MIWIIFILGLLLGASITALIYSFKCDRVIGTIQIDRTIKDEAPMLFLSLNTDVDSFCQEKSVTCIIDNTDLITQDSQALL